MRLIVIQSGGRKTAVSGTAVNGAIDRVEQIAAAMLTVLGEAPKPPEEVAADTVGSTVGLSVKESRYWTFWTRFRDIAMRHQWTTAAPSTLNWWTMPSGVGTVTWTVAFTRFGCRSELYFEHPDPAINLARWQALADRRDEMVEHFGGELFFDDLPKNKGCRVEARLVGPSINDEHKWPKILEWMEDTQLRMRSAIEAVGGIPS